MKKHMLFKKISVLLMAVLIIANSQAAYGLENATEDTPQPSWQSKIQPYLLEKMQDTDDKIPVWLWMEDIDQGEVEQEVYERTGLTEANLSVISEPFSEELAASVAELPEADAATKAEVSSELQTYLTRTQAERALEAQRVDTYIDEMRSVQNEMYCENNASVFSTLGIPQQDIIFTETQAPVYIVYLGKNDIQRLAKNSKVTAIYYYDIDSEDVPQGNDISETVSASSVSRIRSETGLTGSGVKLGVIDSYKVLPCDEIEESRITYVDPLPDNGKMHGTNVARIAAGSYGVAPSASIYSAVGMKIDSAPEVPGLVMAITRMLDNGVCVANYSQGTARNSSHGSYSGDEKYVDFIVRNKRFTLVVASGNDHGVIRSPALAYNVITVGGYFNQGTTDNSDDEMFDGSNYESSYDNVEGCLKPDFVAVQSTCTTVEGTSIGTSYAAPYVTGTIALLYQLRPFLKTQPEAVKAIIMSSCHRKVQPSSGDPVESIMDGLTDHQGAGAIDPYMAIAIAGSGNYGIRTMDSNSTQELIRFEQPAYGSTGLNVSLAWSVENPNGTTVGPEINLDLSLLRNNTQVGSSTQSKSSTEMVYVTPSTTEKNYTIKIDRSSSTGTPVRYAYAFSVNRNRYQYTNISQGVFFLKNRATGQYLTLSNGNVCQTAFSNSSAQQWLLSNGKIYSVSYDNGKLAIGAPFSAGNNFRRAAINTSSGATVIIDVNAVSDGQYNDIDGTVTFFNVDYESALSIYNNSTASGAAAAWSPYSSSDQYQQWYLESVAYQRGDVNIDGVITAADAQKILQYSAGSATPSDVERYLSDVNGDNAITSADAMLANRIAAGLI